MNRSHPPQPGRMTVAPSPAEIIECFPVPRVQLVVVLRIKPNSDLIQVALSTAQFTSRILTADRKLRLALTKAFESGGQGEVTFVFTPGAAGVAIADLLEKVASAVRESVAFEEATLVGAEVLAT